jgi:serine/threonine protein kinase
MLDEFGIAKIGDFGSAEILKGLSDMLCNTSGTYLFLAPECRDRINNIFTILLIEYIANVKQFSGK